MTFGHPSLKRPSRLAALLLLAGALLTSTLSAAPLREGDVPAPLKPWVPWVMHGHEMLSCPPAHNASEVRQCVWPSSLELSVSPRGASFRQEVQVFGAAASVHLPGEATAWPQDVRVGARAQPVLEVEGRPTVLLPPGRHVITGQLTWNELPSDLQLPQATGTLRLLTDGRETARAPGEDGRLWLRQQQGGDGTEPSGDALTLRTARLIDDDIPLRMGTRYELAVSGKPREVKIDAALLPGFVATSLDSALPVRLQEDGTLKVQARPGTWTITIGGRHMTPLTSLSLPPQASSGDESWSLIAHNELRTLSIEGAPQIDPKQVPMPEGWRKFPAYRMKAGDTLKLVELQRGNPQPPPDKLRLVRDIWLDFDGSGYTLRDRIEGSLSRSWRIEMAPPGVPGRVSVNGEDQPVTRLAENGPAGVEVREGEVRIQAESRLDAETRQLPASGWLMDFNEARAQLNLPPGWKLLHAGGVDQAEGSWVNRWTLWDFFFVLLATVAAGRLIGWRSGALLGAALVLTWHMPGVPAALWLLLLGFVTLVKVLPEGKLLRASRWGRNATALVMALVLVPYAVQQVRLSLYPSLEYASGQYAAHDGEFGLPGSAQEPLPEPAPAPAESADMQQAEPTASLRERMAPVQAPLSKSMKGQQRPSYGIDPKAKVQTGPGLPNRRWAAHSLRWQGPVERGQSMKLVLLPPAGTVLLRLGGLALAVAALIALLGGPRGWRPWRRGMPPQAGSDASVATDASASPPTAAGPVAALLAGAALLGGLLVPPPAWASPPTPDAAPAEGPAAPRSDLLNELRERLTAPPACMPNCADVARLLVVAEGSRIQLRLDVHAQAQVMLPLPGQGAQWRPTRVTLDGQSATLRRDDSGALWAVVPEGVHQAVLEGSVGDAANVEIALPLPVRELKSQLSGWALAGLDARGLASGALSLSRSLAPTPGARGNEGSNDRGTQRDALPPFLRIERALTLGLRWTIETRIVRVGPSRVPAQARIRLIEGEAVNDESVRVENGVALVQLGAADEARFVSVLKEAPSLKLTALPEPNQIELWTLDASPQWRVAHSGIAPVQHQQDGRWLPRWQPWPGEQVEVKVQRPAGVAGETLTLDGVHTRYTPGQRATEVSNELTLRASEGRNHRLTLPEGAELMGVWIDKQPQSVQPQGRVLSIPIAPGEHRVQIDWREPRGIEAVFKTHRINLGAPGVNDTVQIQVPRSRVVLAMGGPRVGPAVLFWGVLVVVLIGAVALGRTRLTPLRSLAWLLLGVGLAQASLIGAALVVGWFFALAARERVGDRVSPRLFSLMQVGLVLWTLAAASVMLNTVRVGLLGFPDLMVTGNGSTAFQLNWYDDRIDNGVLEQAWVLTAPVWLYRLTMLGWALWLAFSLLKWLRWGWGAFSSGGYWRPGAWRSAKVIPQAVSPVTPPAAPEAPADSSTPVQPPSGSP
jgi:hypothetical protein